MKYFTTVKAGSKGTDVFNFMLMARREKQDVRHNEEMDKVTESLNNNTSALISLTDKLQQKEVI